MTANRERDWRASAGLSVARGLAASPRVVAPTPSARAFPASVCRAGPYFTAARVLKTAFKEMNWERRGIADAKYGAAKRLARALGVPMEDLEEEE